MNGNRVRPVQLKIVLRGDRRLAESVILEIREAALRCGLEIPSIQVEPRPKIVPKRKNVISRQKTGSRARCAV